MDRLDSRRALATVVLLAIWASYGALLVAIARFEPGRIPVRAYLPGVVAAVLFSAGLLASRRWEAVWRRGFLSTVPVPGWCWIAAGLLAVVSVGLSVAVRVTPLSVLWLGVGCAGASYALVTGADLGWLRRTLSVPSWLVLVVVAGVLTVVGLGVVVAEGAVLAVVFLAALLLFSFHVWFVLPLTLYHSLAGDEGRLRRTDDTDAASPSADSSAPSVGASAPSAGASSRSRDGASSPSGGASSPSAGASSRSRDGASSPSCGASSPSAGASSRAVDASSLPAASVLVPAYEEEGRVGDCLASILASDYPSELLEVVVIDDGSTDGTFEEAARYRDRGVRVLRRENGGKHAALNMGLQCTAAPIVVTVDADSRPYPDAIRRSVRELLADQTVGAVSASVLARTGGVLDRLQHLEYVVSNTNRRAYSVFGAVPVVPGCLGVYRREALEAVWGYDPDTVTEDFDLTFKLLRNGWAVRHGPSAVETLVPGGLGSLWRQRLRWYRGGLETLRKHGDVLGEPRHRYLHALSLPTRLASQLFGPVASFAILAVVLWEFLNGPSTYLLLVVALFLALTLLIALFSLVLEDEPLSYVLYAPLLFVGYKHFVDATVGVGTLRAFLTERRW